MKLEALPQVNFFLILGKNSLLNFKSTKNVRDSPSSERRVSGGK
jgi:hypothetical protein